MLFFDENLLCYKNLRIYLKYGNLCDYDMEILFKELKFIKKVLT